MKRIKKKKINSSISFLIHKSNKLDNRLTNVFIIDKNSTLS